MTNENELIKHTKKLSILFIEDHEELRIQTTKILKKLFDTVDTFTNGQDALNQYINYNQENLRYYDAVLTDIRMPIMDGIELTEKIYKLNQSQVIIVISAYDETKYLLRLINLGIEQFIKKPVKYDDLLKTFLNISQKSLHNSQDKPLNIMETKLDKDTIYSKNTKSINKNTLNIYLTKFEIIFIELLLKSLGKIYSNEEISLHYTSLDEIIDASNIRKLVSKLRKKLPEGSLESIYGIGYKLIPYYD